MTTKKRIILEKKIVRRVVQDLLKAKYLITVNDGEEDVVIDGTNEAFIMTALFTTDMDHLFVKKDHHATVAFVTFVYGNDGYDVIHDYNVSLEPIMEPIARWIDELEKSQ